MSCSLHLQASATAVPCLPPALRHRTHPSVSAHTIPPHKARSLIMPPSPRHVCRAWRTAGVDLGSDLVGQALLRGCRSTGLSRSCWATAGPLCLAPPCLARSQRSVGVCQRKSRVQRRTVGHREGTSEMWSPQEGLLRSLATQHAPDPGREASPALCVCQDARVCLHDAESHPGWPQEGIRPVTSAPFSLGHRMTGHTYLGEACPALSSPRPS